MNYRCAAALAVIAVGIGGCGSSGSGPSPASYRASVDKICVATNAKIRAAPASDANSISGLNVLFNDAAAGVARVKAVTPPSSMSSEVRKWIGSLTRSERDARELLAAVKAGNDGQATTIEKQGSAVNAQGNADARSLGLSACAANVEPSGA